MEYTVAPDIRKVNQEKIFGYFAFGGSIAGVRRLQTAAARRLLSIES